MNWFLRLTSARVLLGVGIALILWCTLCSYIAPLMYDDFAIFRYTGWRLTQGDRLFADVWDHKSPLVFWFCAAGYWLTGGGDWGVETLLGLTWSVTLLCTYGGLRVFLSPRRAALGALLTVMAGIAYGGCGGTALLTVEGLALMVDAVAFWIWARGEAEPGNEVWWRAPVLGMLAAAGLLIKANFVGLGCFLVAAWGLEVWQTWQWHRFWLRGLGAFLGFAIALGGVGALYWQAGTFAELLDASWLFNVYEYRSGGVGVLSLGICKSLIGRWPLSVRFPWVPLYGITCTVTAVCAGSFLIYRGTGEARNRRLVLALGAWFAVETLLVLLSGGIFEHYLLMGYLPLFALVAVTCPADRAGWARGLRIGTLGLLLLLTLYFGRRTLKGTMIKLQTADAQRAALTCSELSGGQVAVRGFISTAKLMLWNRAYTPQKYAFHFNFPVNAKRQERVLEDLVAALEDPKTEAFISEWEVEKLEAARQRYPALDRALQPWRQVRHLPLMVSEVDLYLRQDP